jgi:hypothetical protein
VATVQAWHETTTTPPRTFDEPGRTGCPVALPQVDAEAAPGPSPASTSGFASARDLRPATHRAPISNPSRHPTRDVPLQDNPRLGCEHHDLQLERQHHTRR